MRQRSHHQHNSPHMFGNAHFLWDLFSSRSKLVHCIGVDPQTAQSFCCQSAGISLRVLPPPPMSSSAMWRFGGESGVGWVAGGRRRRS